MQVKERLKKDVLRKEEKLKKKSVQKAKLFALSRVWVESELRKGWAGDWVKAKGHICY